jgi:hypothetical protein
MFAGVLAARWPPATTLADHLLGREHALPLRPATDRDVWGPDGTVDRHTVEMVGAVAVGERGTPWPAATARAYARYHADGDRTEYEDAVSARQERLSRAVVMAAHTLEPSWLDEVADGVLVLCEQSSWCWPAHDDTFTRHGSVLPTVTDPYLDLGAGEVAGQLAWLDHLLGAVLDRHVPGLRARIRHEVATRVFDPFLRRRDWHWLGLDGDVHNWNPWIHGNVLVAALRLAGDDVRARLVALVCEGLDRYVSVLPGDGAVDEGYDYWWYGVGKATEALGILRHATGGAFDHREVASLRAAVAFPHRMHLGGPWRLNVGDGTARGGPAPWHVLHRAARDTGDADALAYATAHRCPGEPAATPEHGLGPLLRGATDPEWLAAETAAPPLPADVWLPSTQVLIARGRAGSADGLTLAVKGGHNGEHHNHNDVGSVVVAAGGVPVLIDPGRPTYTAQTFGPRRYEIWTMRGDWHNVPTIAGVDQSPGREFAARDVTPLFGADRAGLALDIAAAYPVDGSWRREAVLDRRHATVTITDEWRLTAERPSVLHYVLAGEVTAVPGGVLVRSLGGHLVHLGLPDGVPADLTPRELTDPVLRDIWGERITRLDLTVTAPAGTLTIRITEAPDD